MTSPLPGSSASSPVAQIEKRKRSSSPVGENSEFQERKKAKPLSPSKTEPDLSSSNRVETSRNDTAPQSESVDNKLLARTKTEPVIGSSGQAARSSIYVWNDGWPNMSRVWIEDPDQLTLELDKLLADADVVAFDMEWLWDSKARKEGRTAVIQICSISSLIVYGLPLDPEVRCFLSMVIVTNISRNQQTPLHPKIVELLKSDVIKIGNNIKGPHCIDCILRMRAN